MMYKKSIIQQEIKRIFYQLLEPLEFKEVLLDKKFSSYEISVCYVFREVMIEVYVQPRGMEFEVGVNFGRITRCNVDEKYSFHTFLAIVNAPQYYKLGYSIAKSDNEIFQILEIYSIALAKYDPQKFNDDKTFKQIRDAVSTGKGFCPPYYMQPKDNKIISIFV